MRNVHLGQNEDRRTVRVVRPMQLLGDIFARVDVDVVILAQPLPEGVGNLVRFSANSDKNYSKKDFLLYRVSHLPVNWVGLT